MVAWDRSGDVTSEQVALFAKVLGYKHEVAWARRDLEAMAPELRERVLWACRTQTQMLHDPIQDDPALRAAFRQAIKLAETEVGANGPLGHVHALWTAQQRILRARFGIVWFTPAEMNPMVCFD
ncbi:MAG: hypothetical protein IV093_15100 [Rubrivivax sp.]|nr:hypothetical protein [Rubrivivax sp.]